MNARDYFLLVFFLFLPFNIYSQREVEPAPFIGEKEMVPFEMDWETLPDGMIDLSGLLNKPAGNSGFIEIRNGHFYQPDGKRFRIWGVNLTGGACYPEKEEAPKVAKLLSTIGINAVRLHFLDSDWGEGKTIFRLDTTSTRVFDRVQLDKLDYFVYNLIQQGIYVNFNLNVGRNYREDDGVPFYEYLGLAKAVTLFDDRIIELEKEYAKKLLTHVNKYTGNEYRNEPGLAFLEIVNENSLVEAWMRGHLEGTHNTTQTNTWMDIPEFYAKELTLKYNRWLENNLSETKLAELYRELGMDRGKIIPRLKSSEFKNASDLRFRTEARFIMDTESRFFSGMYHYLKDSVGVKQLVAANSDHSHYKSGYALLSSTSKLDFVDGHVYWQHPRYENDPVTGKSISVIENTPMVNDPFRSTVVQLSRSAVKGMPYTVSETNHPYPNEYGSEGILSLGAYALLQDWDGIYFYTFEHDDPLLWKEKTPRNFDILHDPGKMAGLFIGALMFHRRDLESAETIIYRKYDETDMIEGIRKDLGPGPFFTPGFSPVIPLKYQTRIASFSGGNNNFPSVNENEPIISETGELSWYYQNGNGLILINSAKTQALIGYAERMQKLGTTNLKANLNTPFAVIALSSLDGKKITDSRRMLLIAASTTLLSGAQWDKSHTYLKDWGNPPFRIENVRGSISLNINPGEHRIRITPLDHKGAALGKSYFAKKKEGVWNFKLGSEDTVWYLIETD